MHTISYFTLLNKMSTIIVIIIISVIFIIGGAIILNKNDTTNDAANDTANDTSSSSSTIIQPSSSSSTDIYCLADSDWPKTEAGKTASKLCPSGYTGTMSRVCNADGSWSEETTNDCIIPYDTVNDKDVSSGKTLITIHVQYSFYFKYCNDIEKIVNNNIHGIYDFTFTANTNSIAEDYNNVKDTIPSKVFASIQSKIDDINSRNDCKIGQGDINYSYPAKLNVFKNDEYLIIVSNYVNEIETYSYDYPYNYINNSIVTLQSKNPQSIKTTDNILYKMWTRVSNYASDPVCQNSRISYVWGNTVTHIYTNKYITFALILIAMLRNVDVSLSSLGDCKATFRVKQGNDINFILSKEPYCKGIYLFTDVKDSIANFCKVVNTWNGKGWTYTIDLNAEYQSTPTIYNVASKKDLPVFNTGSNLLTENRYNHIINKENNDIPSIHFNQIKH